MEESLAKRAMPRNIGALQFFFADDSKQKSPSRTGMGPLVAIGGVMVSQLVLGALQDDIEAACRKAGFPNGEPFKWSPGPGLWMRDKLKYGAREKFFRSVLDAAGNRGVTAQIIIEDENNRTATGAATHDLDITTMILERTDKQFGRPERRASWSWTGREGT
jgi:hypothetical protein